MRVLAIVGSHRKNGNTASVVRLLAEALQAAATEGELELDTVFLSDLGIESCRGCRLCFDRGEASCPRHDRLLELRDRILAADGVILATPVYVNDVSGTMKTLIDRLAFVCHRPDFSRAAFCLVATTAASPLGHTIRTLESAVLSWGGAIAARLAVAAGAFTPRTGIEAKDGERIRRCARAYYRFLRDRRVDQPAFVSLMVFRIQQIAWGKADPDTVDGRHWRMRGRLQPGSTFYVPHRAHPAKVALARLVGGVVARIFAG